MKIVNAYRSNNGQLHSDKLRAAAEDLHHALPRKSSDFNSKVLDLSDCICILENRTLIEKVFAELDEMAQIELPLPK